MFLQCFFFFSFFFPKFKKFKKVGKVTFPKTQAKKTFLFSNISFSFFLAFGLDSKLKTQKLVLFKKNVFHQCFSLFSQVSREE